MTSWHRECHDNDAEFMTPLGALSRLLRLDRTDRSRWRAALLFDDDHAEPKVALLKPSGELLLVATKEPTHTTARVVVMDRNGWEMQRLLLRQLVDSTPLLAADVQSHRLFRYRTQELDAPDNVAVLVHRVERRRPAVPVTTEAGDRAKVV